jgi:hypothetical protein
MRDQRSGIGPAEVAFLTGVAVFFAIAYALSSALGAHFFVTLRAAFISLLIVCAAVACAYWLGSEASLAIIGVSLLILWPTWWDVLRSIALGGLDPTGQDDLPFFKPTGFYVNGYFLWGIEAMLLVFAVFGIRRKLAYI